MATKNFCSTCGSKLASGARFCGGCGRELPAQQTQQQPQPAQSGSHSQPAPAPPAATTPNHNPAAGVFNYPAHEPHAAILTHQAAGAPATIEVRDLHPNAVWLFFASYVAKTSILLLLFVIGAVLFEPLLFSLAAGGYFLANFLVAKLVYKHYKFEITPTAFRKEYGIVHRQAATIPFERIQNINVSRSMLDRMLGLAHMEIETAGTGGTTERKLSSGITSASEGYVPGVSPTEARDLKELMFSRVQAVRGSGSGL